MLEELAVFCKVTIIILRWKYPLQMGIKECMQKSCMLSFLFNKKRIKFPFCFCGTIVL
jgi:hypothetical protein